MGDWSALLEGWNPVSQALVWESDLMSTLWDARILQSLVVWTFQSGYMYMIIGWVIFVMLVPVAMICVFWMYLWQKLISLVSSF